MRVKSKAAVAVSVVAVAALAGGGAYAATQGSSGNPKQAFLNDVAGRLGISPAKLTGALKAAAIDQVNAAVKAGRLTHAQANEIIKRIQQGETGLGRLPLGPGAEVPGGPPPFGFGPHPGVRGQVRVGGPLGAAASYLGLSRAQLLSDLESGKTLAQVAKAQGKTAAGLKQAMVASITAKLSRAVSSGEITQAQKQQILSKLSVGIGDLINGAAPSFHESFRGGWGAGAGPKPGAFRVAPAGGLPGSPA